ncbi:hypothetical protein ACHAXT_010049 [Thalassiosira profunda]
MRRPYVACCALALPALGSARHRHFAGLGDGTGDAQRLRGRGSKRKKRKVIRPEREEYQAPLVFRDRRAVSDGEATSHDDAELIDFLRKGADHRRTAILDEDAPPGQSPMQSEEPWQLTVIMLLGIVGVLLGLFIHFSTDPMTGQTPYNFRRRIKKKYDFNSPSYKKKTDEWSEDEEVTEDDSYRGDTEGVAGGSIAHKRGSPMPTGPDDPTARLYYQLTTADSFRQQESRLRRSATQQTPVNLDVGAVGGRSRQESTVPAFNMNSPSRPRTSSTQSGNAARKAVGGSSSSPFPKPPLKMDSSGIGAGLEGFGPYTSSSETDAVAVTAGDGKYTNAHPLVKKIGTFTPTESFASMSTASSEHQSSLNAPSGAANLVRTPDDDTPPISAPRPPMSSPRQSGEYPSHYSKHMSELPTPRVDHTRHKRNLANLMKGEGRHIGVPKSLSSSQEDASEIRPATTEETKALEMDDFPGLPLVPNLSHGSDVSPNNFHTVDAPRSVLLEELQLVRMESGVSGPKWRTKEEYGQSTASLEERRQQQQSENLEKLREASAAVDPSEDPRNSIQHIRSDLTISSDASASLSSRINFSDVKLEGVIGGGGFGQVWRAKWKGTPVAVKVLTGSAQAVDVPKAVLEEFIAEINMVGGMRHPNICLFMGACLEPPNRAIVTELCENGSLWDALRTPLSAYQVADGKSRLAWPLELYEPIAAPPPTFQDGRLVVGSSEPPFAPSGAWPWVLFKRVAAGTARGMCYLHSGNPPVLHRDLKSANILLDESYTAKLADFGLSRLKAVRSGMTGNCGTVQWMAPEVLCNEDYAEPADVFSFGIILWEMLTKECPYDGMTPIQCALSVLNENKRPEIPDWCPQSLRALIEKCFLRDPSARPSFSEILTTLDAMQ